MAQNANATFYVTSFCNFAHRLSTGRPIGHECFIIPPRLLRIERDEPDHAKVMDAWRPWHESKGRIVRGRAEVPPCHHPAP